MSHTKVSDALMKSLDGKRMMKLRSAGFFNIQRRTCHTCADISDAVNELTEQNSYDLHVLEQVCHCGVAQWNDSHGSETVGKARKVQNT